MICKNKNMMPQPEVGKHYNLKNKHTGENPFMGYVLIVDTGFIGGKKIFLTGRCGKN